MDKQYKEWLQEQTFETLATDNYNIKLLLLAEQARVKQLEDIILGKFDAKQLLRIKGYDVRALMYEAEQAKNFSLQEENKRLRNLLGKPYKRRIDLENIALQAKNKKLVEALELIMNNDDEPSFENYTATQALLANEVNNAK